MYSKDTAVAYLASHPFCDYNNLKLDTHHLLYMDTAHVQKVDGALLLAS